MPRISTIFVRSVRALFGVGSGGIAVVAIVLVLVSLLLVPLPRPLLDILIVSNLVLGLILLLVGLFLVETSQLHTFPTILLLSTLYRLALNVSSTRLILLGGDQGLDAAGEVIEAFGSFVVQGDFVVGAIIFSIIAVVNFVVITKGSARVAEVSARFTLDALPGKQLAIDSDLRGGAISRDEAQRQRDQLVEESQFYGAMDGAMRFVQGDAIAGFVITFINAVGGVSIGVSRGLEFGTAIDTFGVLTIGDGLVSILPSLLISVCAGIVVTRVRTREGATSSSSMLRQLTAQPKALVIAAIVVLLLGIMPGFPLLPFATVGVALLMSAGWYYGGALRSGDAGYGDITRLRTVDGTGAIERDSYVALPGRAPDAVLLELAPLTVRIDAEQLRNYFDAETTPNRSRYFAAVGRYRESFARERGVNLPDVVMVEDSALERGAYQIVVRDEVVRDGVLPLAMLFVAAPRAVLTTFGLEATLETRHPLTHGAACWLDARARGVVALERLGTPVLEPATFLALETYGGFCEGIEQAFGVSEVTRLLHRVREGSPELIDAVCGQILSDGELSSILRALVLEGVSIRDLKLILEGVIEFHSIHPAADERYQWLSELHNYVRRVLSRKIVSESLSGDGTFRAFVLSAPLEEELRSAAAMWEQSRTRPPVEPSIEAQLRSSMETCFAPLLNRGAGPVVVVSSAETRAVLDALLSSYLPGREWYRTIAYEELDGQYQFETIGVLGAEGQRMSQNL